MPDLSENVIIVIVVAVVLLAALIVMGRRLGRFSVKAGADVSVRDSRIDGSHNEVSARVGKDDDPN